MDYKNEAYEEQVAGYKQRLFERLRQLTPSANAVVVELGIGCWPNAPYYMNWKNVQVLGLEPDSSKHAEAMSRAAVCRLDLACRAEHLDALPPHSADAVVSTCTLCSVDDVQKTLAQVRRVLRPDGVFAFLEHVRSESDEHLAAKQVEATPHELRCWGCRFDRRILNTIEAAGFSRVLGIVDGDACYFDIPTESDLMSPTVVGIALP
jgi:ubiquinone/menaquinone biosynthesis C-methylase UbiE